MLGIIDTLTQWELRDWFFAWLGLVLSFLGVLVAAGIVYLIFLDAGSALRRQERARCFLHLLEVGLRHGWSIEHSIISLSQSRDQTLGVYLHLCAAHLENGLSLNAALEKAPKFLPAQIRAMLKVGYEIGDVPKVITVCRKTLRGALSWTQSNQNRLMVILFAPPIGAVLIWLCAITVLPRFKDILRDFEMPLPSWTEQTFSFSLILSVCVVIIWLLFCFSRLIEKAFWRVSHRLSFWLSWRRKRMQRDFSVMLALLLDSDVPEEKAVLLAAQSTANRVFISRAERVARDLRNGVKLTEAVRWLDDAGEFRWRLRNASDTRRGFFTALAGWHDSLEATAFQQEQVVSQSVTTGFTLLNGLMVGLVAIGLFRMLLAIVGEAVLW